MAQSIGQKLAAARKRRDLTIEDIAHKTRIRAETLRHLEADDYSGFATLIYARSFLTMYSKHLGIDISDFLREFGPAKKDGLEQPEYLNGARNKSRGADSLVPNLDKPRRVPVVALAAILIFVSAVPGMYVLGRMHGFKSAKRITPDTTPQIAAAAKPDTETENSRRPEKSASIAQAEKSTESIEPETIASRPAEVIDGTPDAMPDTVSRPAIELPAAPAAREDVEVRRAAILFEDEDTDNEAETPDSNDSERPQVRTGAQRAVRVEN